MSALIRQNLTSPDFPVVLSCLLAIPLVLLLI